MVAEYALYKGEKLIAMGTAKELAEKLGVNRAMIYRYGAPDYKKKSKGNRRITVRVDK